MEFRISPTFECDCTADTTLIRDTLTKFGSSQWSVCSSLLASSCSRVDDNVIFKASPGILCEKLRLFYSLWKLFDIITTFEIVIQVLSGL